MVWQKAALVAPSKHAGHRAGGRSHAGIGADLRRSSGLVVVAGAICLGVRDPATSCGWRTRAATPTSSTTSKARTSPARVTRGKSERVPRSKRTVLAAPPTVGRSKTSASDRRSHPPFGALDPQTVLEYGCPEPQSKRSSAPRRNWPKSKGDSGTRALRPRWRTRVVRSVEVASALHLQRWLRMARPISSDSLATDDRSASIGRCRTSWASAFLEVLPDRRVCSPPVASNA